MSGKSMGEECERCQEWTLWEDLRDGVCVECLEKDEEADDEEP